MIFKENKVIFYTIHGYGVSQFLQLSVCLFMLLEVVMFLEKDFVVLRQETGMFAVSCVSLTIFSCVQFKNDSTFLILSYLLSKDPDGITLSLNCFIKERFFLL